MRVAFVYGYHSKSPQEHADKNRGKKWGKLDLVGLQARLDLNEQGKIEST